MGKILSALALAGTLMSTASVASAATIVSCGGASSCISDTDNVLLTSASNVAIGTGQTTNPTAFVQFTSTTDLLNLDANGQATISAVDEILNSLTFTLLDGYTFERAEFNLFDGAARQLSVTLLTNTGSTSTFDLNNSSGANRFGITADSGELLSSVTFNSDTGFDSLRQLRLGGITEQEVPGQTGAVPEPSTWAMMLLGFGAVGFGMRRRKRAEPSVRFV